MERKGLEEQKAREAQAEKVPKWQLYCALRQREFDEAHWTRLIDAQFEAGAGDEESRWNTLRESFVLP